MEKTVYFVTHPEVVINPEIPIPQWPLSSKGISRMKMMLHQPWIGDIGSIHCSSEQKAIDGAYIVAEALSLPYKIVESLGENDRSATGFLPKEEFERTADQFFIHPEVSIRGWETAQAAQQRIIRCIEGLIKKDNSQ